MSWNIILLVLYCCSFVLCLDKDHPPHGNHVDNVTDWSASQFKLINDCGLRSPFYIDNPEGVGKFPWLAKLLYTNPKVSECGGALITDSFVLTSKTCLEKKDLTAVLLGYYDTGKDWDHIMISPSDRTLRLEIRRTVLHETSNIGLIRLAEIVNFKSWVHPICLPWNKGIVHKGISGDVAGWSNLDKDTNVLSNSMVHNNTMTVVQIKKCYTELSYHEHHKDNLCATGSSTGNTCRGMPGGPLMMKKENKVLDVYYTIGIQSYEENPCEAGRSILYTNVGYHIDWILDNLEPVFDI